MAYEKFKRANLYNLIMSTHLKKRHSAHPTGAHRTARSYKKQFAFAYDKLPVPSWVMVLARHTAAVPAQGDGRRGLCKI